MKKKLLCAILILFIILPQVSMRSEAASGKWKKDAKGYYYVYSNGSHSKKGWKTISGKKYYFNAKGYRVTGWKKINGKKYYFSKKGVMQTGWLKLSGKKYYFGKKGAMVTGWKKIGKKKYYFNAKGALNTKSRLTIKGVTYLFNKDGSLKKTEAKKEEPKACTHNWVWKTSTKTVHHDAVTGTYEKCVEADWTEYFYVQKYYCGACKKYYDSWDDYDKKDKCYGGWSLKDVLDHTVDHPAKYQTVTYEKEPAWDETVEVKDYQYCSKCGVKK